MKVNINRLAAIICVAVLIFCGVVCYMCVLVLSKETEPSANELITHNNIEEEEQQEEEPTEDAASDSGGEPIVIPSDITYEDIMPIDPKEEEYTDLHEQLPSLPEDYIENYLSDDVLKGQFAKVMPYDVELYISSAKEFDDRYEVRYCAKNTDVEQLVTITKDVMYDDDEYLCESPLNKYGSDFPYVYFNNGVPENSLDIYDAIYLTGNGEACMSTDYISGDTCTLLGVSGKTYTVNLNGGGGK